MTHYDFHEWVHLVRGEMAAERATEMTRHLSEGCSSCGDLHGSAEELVDAADTTRRGPLTLPESVLWAAKALLGRSTPADPAETKFRTLSHQLVYEAPATAPGLRSGAADTSWQGVYHVDGLSVDLRMDFDPGVGSVCVIGQIADLEREEPQMAQLPACLKVDESTIAYAVTNDLGEFRVEYDARLTPELRVGIPDRGLFAVTLDRRFVLAEHDEWASFEAREESNDDPD